MTFPSDGAHSSDADSSSRLGRLFVLIVLAEASAITALYWFGKIFS